MSEITKFAYQELIDCDLKWLLEQPDTLERRHIESIVKASIEYEYPSEECKFCKGTGYNFGVQCTPSKKHPTGWKTVKCNECRGPK